MARLFQGLQENETIIQGKLWVLEKLVYHKRKAKETPDYSTTNGDNTYTDPRMFEGFWRCDSFCWIHR